MRHLPGTARLALVVASAVLIASASASAVPLRLSDTIRIVPGGGCRMTSDATDVDSKLEARRIFVCTVVVSPDGFLRITVPNSPDEALQCLCKVAPSGAITGQGREGTGAGAYSATVRGMTKPGAHLVDIPKAGASIQVWEIPSAP